MSKSYPFALPSVTRVRDKEGFISKKLGEYFSSILPTKKLEFLSNDVSHIAVSDVRKLNSRSIGNNVYSFLLTYRSTDSEQRINLVLKTYAKALDPVFRISSKDENLERCVKEFQVLRGLGRANFPVPKVYLYECDSKILGFPFIILQKEEPIQKAANIDSFTKNLVRLHSLDPSTLGIDAIKTPGDIHAFARQCLLYIKIYLNLYPIRRRGLEKDFEFAIRWLETNVISNPCSKYCLLHGDYRANFNTIITRDSGMVVTDWEDAKIGDPAFDLGIAYAREKVDLGKESADQFVQEYLNYHNGDIDQRLLFYKLVANLRLALSHNAILSNPLRAYEIRGPKAFLLFPFLGLPFVAKKIGTDLDLIWVDNFKEFVRENLRR